MERVTKTAHIKSQNGNINVIFTKEIQDRDGEIVSVDGINTSNFEKNPVVLDTHSGSSILDILGKAKNIRKESDADGIKMLTGDIEFADHPKAKFAEQMVRKGELNTVSIGFNIKDFDSESNTITSSELLELSFVPVPANPAATVQSKQAKFHELTTEIDKLNDAEDIYKKLANYEDIHPKIKNFRKLFLNDDFCKLLEYEKTGNELTDYKNIYDLLIDKLQTKSEEESKEEAETESIPEETPKEEAEETKEETPESTEATVEADGQYVTRDEVKEIFENLFNILT